MLDINPIRKTPYHDLPPKTVLMREVAAKLGRSDQFLYPNLAVNFDDPKVRKPNKFGAVQGGCNHCGECDVGCNNQAKNTLDLNYLKAAENTGNIDLSLQTSVTNIEPAGDGYRVHYRNHASDTNGSVEARAVFVCAGAINTTELLLRCRDEARTLPRLSPALGHRYSGNGDYLAFAFETERPFEPSVGPTITTGIVYDRGPEDDRTWFIFQEGGFPRELASLIQTINPNGGALQQVTAHAKRDVERLGIALGGEHVGKHQDVGASSAVFLAMGRDLANGRIEVLPATNLLRIQWDVPSNMPLYSEQQRFSNDVAKALGGKVGYNPFWKFLHQPISVHNLGGCVMAEHPADGVIDPGGEAFGYPNLFVLDGAALPASTGTNPSHTIAAVAERNIERFIRRFKNAPAWRSPEAALAKPIEDPMNRLTIPKEGTAPPETPSVGIKFTETMKGFVTPTTVEPASTAEYEALASKARGKARGKDRGKKTERAAAQFVLTITIADMDSFVVDKHQAAIAVGEVRAAGFTPSDGAKVTAGVFNLFDPTEEIYARRMLYTLPFYGAGGQPYILTGFKDVRDHGWFDVWGSTSTLFTTIRRGHDPKGPVAAAGVLHILKRDFARQLTTFRPVGGGSALDKVDAMGRFGRLFVGTLFDVFVRPRLEL
jgi:cholesterol oxidase